MKILNQIAQSSLKFLKNFMMILFFYLIKGFKMLESVILTLVFVIFSLITVKFWDVIFDNDKFWNYLHALKETISWLFQKHPFYLILFFFVWFYYLKRLKV